MKSKLAVLFLALATTVAYAQQAAPPSDQGPFGPGPSTSAPPPRRGPGGARIVRRRPMHLGAWWKNSDIATKLNLTDAQKKQLEDTFYQHRLKLIDDQAEMEKADLKLRELLDADTPNEQQVMSQVDQVLAARGKVEREFTLMTLNFRKILSVQQWKQLRDMMPTPGPGFHGPMGGPGFGGQEGGRGPGPGPAAEMMPPPPAPDAPMQP